MENSKPLDPASDGDLGLSPWQKTKDWLWNAWRTATRGTPERRYARRVMNKLKNGRLHATLGIEVRDAEYTKAKAEKWLGHLQGLGLRPEHLCVEYGCGSLWAAEPVIHYLQPGRFIGLDVTSEFYDLGRQRLGGLIAEKQVRLAVIDGKSVRETAALHPDFVYSRKVLPHVPRRGLPRYVRNIASLVGEQTIVLIDNTPVNAPDGSIQGRRHSAGALQPYLPTHVRIRQLDFGLVLHHASRTLPAA
jgi:hypothetical protein